MKFRVFSLVFISAVSRYSAADVFTAVDQFFGKEELGKLRVNPTAVDQCSIDGLRGGQNFASQLQTMMAQAFTSDHSELEYIAGPYQLPASRIPVSLASHPMCSVSAASLEKTLKFSHRVPSAQTIERINRFASAYNVARSSGNQQALSDLWGRMFSCLSYVESLSNPDTETAYALARQYGPEGYVKPDGVSFYLDRSSSEGGDRYLTVGLYQFNNKVRGNILACVKRWNRMTTANCQIDERGADQQTLLELASPYQSFNAFCGVDKVLQSFYVQVNSTNPIRTHPENLENGSLKAGADRCVSLHFFAGYTYNHFGPLQNSIADNLGKLMSCVMP